MSQAANREKRQRKRIHWQSSSYFEIKLWLQIVCCRYHLSETFHTHGAIITNCSHKIISKQQYVYVILIASYQEDCTCTYIMLDIMFYRPYLCKQHFMQFNGWYDTFDFTYHWSWRNNTLKVLTIFWNNTIILDALKISQMISH